MSTINNRLAREHADTLVAQAAAAAIAADFVRTAHHTGHRRRRRLFRPDGRAHG